MALETIIMRGDRNVQKTNLCASGCMNYKTKRIPVKTSIFVPVIQDKIQEYTEIMIHGY